MPTLFREKASSVRLKQAKQETFQRFCFDSQAMSLWPQVKLLWGMDEVGRGSLMGPVVAACVAFADLRQLDALSLTLLTEQLHPLNDSKKLKPVARESLRLQLQAGSLLCPVYWGVGEASVEEIDRLNILQASHLAGWRAYQQACERFPQIEAVPMLEQALLLDGNKGLPFWPEEARQRCVVKGDSLSASIAAASVLAKQHRDGWVQQKAAQVDEAYGWHRNMGYATAQHCKAIQALGATPWHRPLFLRKLFTLS